MLFPLTSQQQQERHGLQEAPEITTPRVSALPLPHAQLCCAGCCSQMLAEQEPGPPWGPEPQSPGYTGARAVP